MKRGLKHRVSKLMRARACSPNPGPDEEGIETIWMAAFLQPDFGPNPGPDEEGIETFSISSAVKILPRPNPGPDEEGIETSVSTGNRPVWQ